MNDAKYIGLDVHQATISAAVLDSAGKLVMECILETKAATILQFIHGIRGSLHAMVLGTAVHVFRQIEGPWIQPESPYDQWRTAMRFGLIELMLLSVGCRAGSRKLNQDRSRRA